MVYKIENNEDYNVLEKIEKLKESYDMIFYKNILYISTKDFFQEENFLKNLKKVFKPTKNFFFVLINEKNLSKENEVIIEWCKKHFIEMDLQRFEAENQNKLKDYMNSLYKLEENLKEKLNDSDKKGGN